MSETFTCPVCKDDPALEEIFERDVPFRGCTACFGLLVLDDNLEVYVERAAKSRGVAEAFRELLEKALAGTTSTSKRLCPRCGENMLRFGFGDAPFSILDRCRNEHGIWLDKKELKKVQRASRAYAAVLGKIPKFDEDAADEDE